MGHDRNVPGWYRFQCGLIGFQPARSLLFLYHRIKKRLCKTRELSHLKLQPQNLRHFEKRVFSQNGEDGMLEEIFRRIGITNRVFVEFGVQDGIQCCTRNLLENFSWSGTWFECSAEHVANAKEMFREFPITIVERFLTAEQIAAVFVDAGVNRECDLMVIDVDGNDYWMWNALAEQFRPRVVVVEYNGTFGPKEEWIMPYDPQHRYDMTAYFGASLTSFTSFASKHGYSLVGCDSEGVNAFFVRNDAAKGLFDGLDKAPAYHYVAPYYDIGFGHVVAHH
jgi:hypothetical protein